MNNVVKRIEIDLYSPTSYEVIKAQQGDNNSRVIEFALYDQGKPYIIPNNISIKMEGHRGDNSYFSPKDCTVTDNIITVALDSDILYEPGIVEAKIVMYNNDSILSTIPFKIHVQKSPCDKNKLESEKSSVIDWLVLNFNKLKTSFEEHLKDFSNLSSNLTEHIGDNVRHIISTERTKWDEAYNKRHTHSNETTLDNTTASYTAEEKSKLNGIQDGAEVNVQADWNINDATSDAYIKNKPSIYTKSEIAERYYDKNAVDDKFTGSNSGVRSISEGSANGTISVNTNGSTADVAVKGLGSAAYTNSSAYAASGHTHNYLPTSGGTITGNLRLKGSGNYGNALNFGDDDYVHISEPTDDNMEIKAKNVNFAITGNLTLNDKKILTIDQIYPVGSIYMSVNSTSPATLFGGTWVRWGNGRVAVGVDTTQTEFSTVEKTDGAKTHTLTTAEMPSHSHTTTAQTVTTTSNGNHQHKLRYVGDATCAGNGARINSNGTTFGNANVSESTGAHTHNVTIPASTTDSTGTGNAHNNLQPYITCYMWKRTA